MTATPPRADLVREGERIRAEIAAHPRAVLIDALADTMHAIEDDMGTGRHINDYLCLAYATVEMLPSLVYDENATCDEPGCGAHPATQVTIIGDAAAAPPAGLSATVPAENAPAVPEEADGRRAAEGGFRLKRRTDAERADYLTQKLVEMMAERNDALADRNRLWAELQRVHAQVAHYQNVIEAAKAWRAMRLGTPTRPKPESFALIAAVDALPDAGTGQTEGDHEAS